MHRKEGFDEMVSRELRTSKKYAQEFFLGLLEEDNLSVQEALQMVIHIVGLKEYSEFSGIETTRISKFLHGTRKPKLETLDRFFAPFGLETKLILQKKAS